MFEPSLYRRIVSGRAGVWAAPLRGVLGALEAVYACGVSIRNARYDRDGFCRTLPVPVLSVGNLTVGGTGKTPLVTEPAKPTSDHSGRSNYLDVRICRIAIRTVNQVRVSGEFHA